jgi:2-dehydropantoate 2-reductase
MALRIGVMGTGAIGGYVGGKLAVAGSDVVFIGRERTKREVDENGLRVIDIDGATARLPPDRVAFAIDLDRLAPCDVVLCCVKSGATLDTAHELKRVLRRDAVVVSLQNGVRNPEDLRKHLDQKILAGIVNFNVLSKGKATFRQATSGAIVIEGSTDAATDQLTDAMRAAGLLVERPLAIREIQWAKLVLNLNNAVSALSDRPTREIVLSAGYRRVLASLMKEALSVLDAAGIAPARLGAVPLPWIVRVMALPTPLVRLVAWVQLRIDPEARSSMWEDLTAGRLTEVDWLNGEIVRLADSCGAPAERNRKIVEVVHAAEKAGRGSPKMSADALWQAITAGGVS